MKSFEFTIAAVAALLLSATTTVALADEPAGRIASVYVSSEGTLQVTLMDDDGTPVADLCPSQDGSQDFAEARLADRNRDLLTLATSAFLSGQPVVLRTRASGHCVLEGMQLERE